MWGWLAPQTHTLKNGDGHPTFLDEMGHAIILNYNMLYWNLVLYYDELYMGRLGEMKMLTSTLPKEMGMGKSTPRHLKNGDGHLEKIIHICMCICYFYMYI